MTVGFSYVLGFWWAGAQQSGYTGPNTEGWQVSMTGDATQDTAIASNVSEGFTGWRYQQFTFVATTANPILSFLAVGTPTGEPPFSLIDGISLQAVPEPGTCALIPRSPPSCWLHSRSSSTPAPNCPSESPPAP